MPARPATSLVACLAVATVLSACTSDGSATPVTTSTPDATDVTTAPASCPDGIDAVPPGEPARSPAPLEVRSSTDVGGDGVLDVGLVLETSSPLRYLAPAALAATELAIDDLNAAGGVLGAPVTLSLATTDAGGAQGAARTLVDAGVDVLLAPAGEAASLAVIDAVTSAGVVMLSAHDDAPLFTDQDDRGLYFRTAPSDVLQGRALADLVAEDGARRVAVLARSGAFAEPIRAAFRDEAARAGLRLVFDRTYDATAEPDDLARTVDVALAESPDAVVVIGLAESGRLVDALADAGAPPSLVATYGVSGNLGDRLGEAVTDPTTLGCMRGVIPGAPVPNTLRRRLLAHDPDLVELADAAESYDAVVIAALAAEAAGTDDGPSIGRTIEAITNGGARCDRPTSCLDRLRDPEDPVGASGILYDGFGGTYQLSPAGDPTIATFRVVQFDAGGHLQVVGAQATETTESG